MKKKTFWALSLLLMTTAMFAIPAKRTPFTVTNSDGTVLTLILCGDESYHFYTTTDGIPVVQEENGDFRLAPELKDSIRETWTNRSKRFNAPRRVRAKKQTARRIIGERTHHIGNKKGIVILVNFKNLSMKSANDNSAFYNAFNQEGYNKNYHYGSVHDYFLDQSYGKLNLTFDVFGPVTLSNNYSYYGSNDSEGYDKLPATMVAEACKLADKNYNINWSDYDWDDDGEVDQVFVVYAGYSESAGASAKTIWPHEFSLSMAHTYHNDGNGAIKLGGCTIDTYAVGNELSNTSGNTMEGIGTACHEFSHCLGFNDHYDTSYDGGFGMSNWDLMDAGSFCGENMNGECPAGFTAYERWLAGWLEFIELKEPATITDMPALQDSATAYIIYNDGNDNECFILENRQNRGWFKYFKDYTSCHGLLVTHVDYDEKVWEDLEVNNDANHQRMSIIPANNNYGTLSGVSGDRRYDVSETVARGHLFPGYKKVTELTNTSHQYKGGKLFNKNTDGTYYMNKPITEIAESTEGLISFKFMGGAKEEPKNEKISITDITDLIDRYLSQPDE